ncbi:hypothetical protein IKQ19_20335 [Candidatus Saccharibacteria bacterium]|nr:hypothetical protein [Candidatus Saccharibacteria bacterium]
MSKLSQRIFLPQNTTNVQILFVMESPGKEELQDNYACTGETGKIMSHYLCDRNPEPLGKLMQSRVEDHFAIFETFTFPLESGLQDKTNPKFEQVMSQLKVIDNIKSTRQQHYANLENFWKELDPDQKQQFVNAYKDELIYCVKQLNNNTQIVFCGFIAQSCFMQAFPQKETPPYMRTFATKQNKERRILFSNHPSVELYDNGPWCFGKCYRRDCAFTNKQGAHPCETCKERFQREKSVTSRQIV